MNLFVKVLLLSNNIQITHVLTIFHVILKIGILVHLKTHVKSAFFYI